MLPVFDIPVRDKKLLKAVKSLTGQSLHPASPAPAPPASYMPRHGFPVPDALWRRPIPRETKSRLRRSWKLLNDWTLRISFCDLFWIIVVNCIRKRLQRILHWKVHFAVVQNWKWYDCTRHLQRTYSNGILAFVILFQWWFKLLVFDYCSWKQNKMVCFKYF